MTAITVNARCMTPTCPWMGRVRTVRQDAIGLGQGLHGMLRLACECGSEPEVEVVSLGPQPVTVPAKGQSWVQDSTNPQGQQPYEPPKLTGPFEQP